MTRHHGSNADQHANEHRQMKEPHHTRKAHCRSNGLLAQHGDVQQVDQVHRKNGHQPDGSRARHDDDVPQE
jgi:hypothetical protein